MKRGFHVAFACSAFAGALTGCGEPVFLSTDPAAAIAEVRNRKAEVARVVKAFIMADAIERAIVDAECPPGPPPLGAFRVADAEYQGEVCIGGGDPTYTIRWKLDNGETYFGQGLVVGDRLIIGFNADGAGFGVAVYDLDDDGANGTWSSSGATAVGMESIEKLFFDPEEAEPDNVDVADTDAADVDAVERKPASGPKVFSVRGQNPNGSEYDGNLEVLPNGVTKQLTWRVGEERFRGVGLVDENLFAVGWGTTEEGLGVMIYRIEEDKLHGRWAFIDDVETRVENLVPRLPAN